jgi:hypothetical protein
VEEIMTEKGEELFRGLKGVRDFLSDLAQLLVAGDGLMAEHSWEPVGDATCLQGLSYSMYQGRLWLPRAAFRRYTNKAEQPRVVAMISLILDEEIEKLTEPVLAGTEFVFPDTTPEEKIWVGPWNASWAGWRKAPLDGSPIIVDDNDQHWNKSWGWRYMKTFARPLVNVTSQSTLQELIVAPLLGLLREPQEPVGSVSET